MNKMRSVNTHFWNDNYVIDLDPIEKLLFLYLLTNPNTNMLGIYELHIRKIAFDTGIDKDMVLKIFERFQEAEKASYLDGYVCLFNFTKHQSYNSNMKISAVNSFKELPLSIQESDFVEPLIKGLEPLPEGLEPFAKKEKEKEKELEKETIQNGEEKYSIGDAHSWNGKQRIDYVGFVDKFNDLYGLDGRTSLRITESKREQIRGRLRTWTGEEILRAWEHRLEDPFLNDEGSKYLANWESAMRNDQKIERYQTKTETNNAKKGINTTKLQQQLEDAFDGDE